MVNSSKESKFIMYLDANYLYGWVMSQYHTVDLNG